MACILTCYYRPKPGGLCKRLFRALNALLDRGHIIHYLSVVPFPIEHPNCHFHRFPWPKKETEGFLFWGVFHALGPLFLLFIGVRHSVTHSFAFGSNYSLMLQPLRLLKGARLSLFLRGDLLARHRDNQRPYWLIKLETFFEGFAMQSVNFHCVSNSLQAAVFSRNKRFVPRRCLVLPNEIPPAGFRSKRSVNATFSVGSVGTLHKGKNQSLLLNSIASISADKIRLLIFGVGPEESNLRVLAGRLKVADRVHYMGWAGPDEVWGQVDLLLFPSVHEGSPNAVLEAIAHGIPVLASDIPEHREILPAESLFPIDDPDPWTRRLLNILENSEELSRLTTTQREHSKRLRFDWDRAICELITGRI